METHFRGNTFDRIMKLSSKSKIVTHAVQWWSIKFPKVAYVPKLFHRCQLKYMFYKSDLKSTPRLLIPLFEL